MRKRRTKLKKRAILMAAVVVLTLCSVITQIFFMPKWFDGNIDADAPANEGVHTQSGTELNQTNTKQRQSIKITN